MLLMIIRHLLYQPQAYFVPTSKALQLTCHLLDPLYCQETMDLKSLAVAVLSRQAPLHAYSL